MPMFHLFDSTCGNIRGHLSGLRGYLSSLRSHLSDLSHVLEVSDIRDLLVTRFYALLLLALDFHDVVTGPGSCTGR